MQANFCTFPDCHRLGPSVDFFFKTRQQVIVAGEISKKSAILGPKFSFLTSYLRQDVVKQVFFRLIGIPYWNHYFHYLFFQAQKLLEAEKYFDVVPIPRPSSKIVTADAQIEQVNCILVSFFCIKVSFFSHQCQDMSLSGFPPKNRPLICRPDRPANQRPLFVGKRLNSCPD